MKEKNVLILIIIALLVVLATLGTYTIFTLDSNSNPDTNIIVSNNNTNITEAMPKAKTWNKIDSFSGTLDQSTTRSYNSKNPVKIVASGRGYDNSGDNFLRVMVYDDSNRLGYIFLEWTGTKLREKKSDSIQFTENKVYNIDVASHEMESWTVTIYEYY